MSSRRRAPRATELALIAVLAFCLGALSGCDTFASLTHRPGAAAQDGPACDDTQVTKEILDIANTHPNYAPYLPARALRLQDIRQPRLRETPSVNPNAFQRLCVAQMSLANGETLLVGWEIMGEVTGLGLGWGLRPCFGPYDPGRLDCSAYASGRLPGEK